MAEPQAELRPHSRRGFLRRLVYLTGGAGLGLGAGGYLAVHEKEWLRVRRVQLPAPARARRLEGMKIALLTDFHLYPHTTLETAVKAVDLANEFEPDLVVLGGDYVLSTADSIFDLAKALQGLNSGLGVFAILGNHDHWRGPEVVAQGLAEAGAELLRNQSIALRWRSQDFVLGGVDDGWVGRQDLRQTLQDAPADLPTIVMMHEPDFADEFAQDGRVDIQLSGHSHGGQVRLPWYGSPFLPPYGRKYDQGLYEVSGMSLYTSVGIGVTVPIRLNCPPEVTHLTLG